MSTTIQDFQQDFLKTLQDLKAFENSLNRQNNWPCEYCDDDEKGLSSRYDDCVSCETEHIKRTMTDKTAEVFNAFKSKIRHMLAAYSKDKIKQSLVESNILLPPLREVILNYCPDISDIINEKFIRPIISDNRSYSLFEVAVLNQLDAWCRYRKLELKIYETRISIVSMMLACGANPGIMGIVKYHKKVNGSMQSAVIERSLTLVNRARIFDSFPPIIKLLEENSKIKKDDETASATTSTAFGEISIWNCQRELINSKFMPAATPAATDIVPANAVDSGIVQPSALSTAVTDIKSTAAPLLLLATASLAMAVSGKLFKS